MGSVPIHRFHCTFEVRSLISKAPKMLTSLLACWELGWWTPTTELFEMQIYSGSFSGNLAIPFFDPLSKCTIYQNGRASIWWKYLDHNSILPPPFTLIFLFHSAIKKFRLHCQVATWFLICYRFAQCQLSNPIWYFHRQNWQVDKKSNNIDHTISCNQDVNPMLQ